MHEARVPGRATLPGDEEVLASDGLVSSARLKVPPLESEVDAPGVVSLTVRRGHTRLIGGSRLVRELVSRFEAVAASEARVLVSGESGTGKELVTRMIHEASQRRDGPFVAINCAAFPLPLLEAELFGHERGAFSGAHTRRTGRFQAADGGTLFLDEVAELPLPAQAKLLRVLEVGCFEPLGTNRTVKVDVRVIAATHCDLRARVRQGLFREDLYYRLKVVHLRTPPLRERAEDIPMLVAFCLAQQARAGAPAPTIAPDAMAALERYPFPGNVRELQHALQQAAVLAGGGQIEREHLPAEIGAEGAEAIANGAIGPLVDAVSGFEREYLVRALSATSGNRSRCARMLGISRKCLWEKRRRYGITDDELTPAEVRPAG